MHLRALLLVSVVNFVTASIAVPSFAQSKCGIRPTHYQEALHCAEENSPDLRQALLTLKREELGRAVAQQWKNPELSVNTVHGSGRGSETDVALSFPIELGGKISARSRGAQSAIEEAQAEVDHMRAIARNEALLKFHRLRQLLHEEEVIGEAISTFSKLVARYGGRPRLSPEQELTATVFRMSKSEYELKKSEVNDEIASIDSFLKLRVGSDVEALREGLPKAPKDWPKISARSAFAKSPELRAANARRARAQAELDLAAGEKWPTISFGPSMKVQSEADSSRQLYGLNLSLPIPVFTTGKASEQVASASLSSAEVAQEFVIKQSEQSRNDLVGNYQRSVAVLTSTLSHQDIERKHTQIERLFMNGTVASSLVIEAHRTFVELEKSRNEREMKALEALTKIRSLDGKDLEN